MYMCVYACSMYVISALEIHILITICYYDKNLRKLHKKSGQKFLKKIVDIKNIPSMCILKYTGKVAIYVKVRKRKIKQPIKCIAYTTIASEK